MLMYTLQKQTKSLREGLTSPNQPYIVVPQKGVQTPSHVMPFSSTQRGIKTDGFQKGEAFFTYSWSFFAYS